MRADSWEGADPAPAVDGRCAPRFHLVGEAFADVVASGRAGSALAIWHDGRMVVDLWGGRAGCGSGQRWARDTLVMPYSVSKPFAAVCALLLVQRGLLVLDAPARRYWPELTCDATVRQILDHTAGLVLLDEPAPTSAFFDWSELCARLARQRPAWVPGSAVGESALFYGHLVGELVRRIDGRSLGTFLRQEICRPAGLVVHVGLSAVDLPRVADLMATPRFPRPGGGPLSAAAASNPPGAHDTDVVNSTPWRQAEIPAVNAHVTARAVAEFYALLAGGHVLHRDLVAEMTTVQAAGVDAVTGRDVRWGLGVGVEPDGWGMGGIGGSLGMWSDEGGYAYGFVAAELDDHGRADRLENVLRSCLGLPPL
jgi:CubicO group peptidase (beta-lactamase class C family)